MKYIDLKLSREQLDKKLKPLQDLAISGMPQQGWIKTIREALGMSSSALGEKAGLDQSRISRLESAEKLGNLKVSSLQKIANALGMRFVYGFVPESNFEDVVRSQAENVALHRMKRLDKTMQLEMQGLSEEDKKKAVEDMVTRLLIEDPKSIWEAADE